jgi:hypothetical protein
VIPGRSLMGTSPPHQLSPDGDENTGNTVETVARPRRSRGNRGKRASNKLGAAENVAGEVPGRRGGEGHPPQDAVCVGIMCVCVCGGPIRPHEALHFQEMLMHGG